MTARVNPIIVTSGGVVRVELTAHQTWHTGVEQLAALVGSSPQYFGDLCERATNPDLPDWDRALAHEELMAELGTSTLHLDKGRATEIAHDLQQLLRSPVRHVFPKDAA